PHSRIDPFKAGARSSGFAFACHSRATTVLQRYFRPAKVLFRWAGVGAAPKCHPTRELVTDRNHCAGLRPLRLPCGQISASLKLLSVRTCETPYRKSGL